MRNVIVYVGGFELPDRNAAAQRVLANSLLLRDLGYEVVLIGMNRDLSSGSGIKKEKHAGIDFDCWSMPYPRSSRQWLRYISSARPLRRLLETKYPNRIFATVCYNFPALAQYDLLRWCRRSGAIAIADVTEWYGAQRIRSLSSLIKNLDVPLRMRWVNRRMDALITTSPFLTRYYERSVKKLVELPGLFDHPPLPFSSLHRERQAGAPARLFFAGTGFDPDSVRLSKDGLKDRLDWVMEVVHEAHRRGRDFRFDIFGVTEADYLKLMPGQSRMLTDLAGKAVFHGRQPRPMVIRALVDADFSIFMRAKTLVTQAGFPTKFAESINYGTPVLTNAMENVAPYLVEGRNGYWLEAGNLSAAADTLCRALDLDGQTIDRMKEYCLASEPFNYRSFMVKVSDWLSTLKTARTHG